MAANLACDKFWVNKNMYHDAEKKFYECTAKLQRRLEVLGGKSEETNNKKTNNSKSLKKYKKTHNNVVVDELKKELLKLEAQENAKNKIFHSESQCFEIIKSKEDCYERNDSFIDSEKKKQNKEQQKEKKSKSEKKPKRSKENEDDLLGGVGMAKINPDAFPKSSLAGEVAKARQHIKSSLECMESINGVGNLINPRLTALLEDMKKAIENLTKRVEVIEKNCMSCNRTCQPQIAVCPAKPQPQAVAKPAAKQDDDEDIDLFSDSEEENEEAKKIREQRLAEYAAKKSKKPALVAKSNIILDIKPWDDETDMKEMEKAVRAIEMDGLIWGASKLVPVAFKIFKLQISCVIEDDKVSVDVLTETLESIEEYIQSVDIAAFNKV